MYRTTYAFGPARFHFETDDAQATQWVEEFLQPWFEVVEGDAPFTIRLVHDDDAFDALKADVWAAPVPCFRLDSKVLSFRSRQTAAGLVLEDADRGCFLVVDGPCVDVVARRGAQRCRLTVARIARERIEGGVALHAAAVEIGGKGIALAGVRRSGKTSLLLHMLTTGGRYIANDRVLVTGDDEVVGVPTVVNLRSETLAMFPRVAAGLPPSTRLARSTLAELDAGLVPEDRGDDLHLSPVQLLRQLDVGAIRSAPLAAVVLPEVALDVDGVECSVADPDRILTARYGTTAGATVFGSASAADADAELLALASRVPVLRCRLGPRAYEDGAARKSILRWIG